jgi:M6 family metalloprotease-like protein
MKKLILLSALLLFCFVMAKAIPAYRGAIKITQPDGSVLTFNLVGDENSHHAISTDGLVLLQDNDGFYRYATYSNGQLTAKGSPVAHDLGNRTTQETEFLKSGKAVDELSMKCYAHRSPAKVRASDYQIGDFPTKGDFRGIVILAEFTDAPFTLDSLFHSRMLNESGFSDDGATGSARDYYTAQSMGQFVPRFDVVGPVKLSHPISYYGKNATWPSSGDVRASQMIAEACQIAHDSHGLDFSNYDLNNDGKVDMVYVIFSGYGENFGADANTIWPHKYELTSAGIDLNLNSKQLDTYACSAELFGNTGTQSCGIGALCHEFGHVLGFADHYNTTSSTTYELGRYDIMDYGSYNNDCHTPPAYNAFERMQLGWLIPTEVTEPKDGVTLKHIENSNEAYILRTTNKNEFFLLENRQQEGWDKYIQGKGMMITHLDFDMSVWNANTVNDEDSHRRFYLIPADSESNYDVMANHVTESTDLYPIAGNNAFTDQSSPAAVTYVGTSLDRWVTDIEDNDGVVSFNVMANHLKTPSNLNATEITDNSFVANWNKVENADSYTVNLYKLIYESDNVTALTEGFYKMSDGSVDAPDSKNVSDMLDKYTTKSGWTGEQVYQAGEQVKIGNAAQSGKLTTPNINLSKQNGNFAVVVKVKSATGKTPVFTVSANGESGKTRLTSNARDYLYQFTSGITKTNISFEITNERAFIDTIIVVRGNGADLYPNAKVVSVTGTPASTASEVVDDPFIHVDTVTVEGIKNTFYKFNNLEKNTNYSFTVQAINASKQSAFSTESFVYTDATAINNATTDNTNARTYIYRIDGTIANDMLNPGIYIVKKGNETKKVIVK